MSGIGGLFGSRSDFGIEIRTMLPGIVLMIVSTQQWNRTTICHLRETEGKVLGLCKLAISI